MATSSVLFESLSLSDLRRMGSPAPPAITVLLPAVTPGSQGHPNSLRIRTAVDALFPKLLGLGLAHHEIARIVAPLLALASDASFREGSRKGMALFLDGREFFCFDVPADVPESVVAGRHFYVRPLLSWLSEPREFLILELSPAEVRLLRCRDSKLADLGLPGGVPGSLEDMSLEPAPVVVGARQSGRRFRGHVPAANEEHRIEFFCTMVDRALQAHLEDLGLPVVVAGTERIVSSYQRMNTYPRMVAEALKGELTLCCEEETYAHARRLIHQERAHEAAGQLLAMEEYAPGDRWSTSIEDIVRGAANGRVWRLFLAEGATHPGDFLEILGRPNGRPPLYEDMLNASAMETLTQGGEVFLVDAETLPGKVSAAALFRYSLGPDVPEC